MFLSPLVLTLTPCALLQEHLFFFCKWLSIFFTKGKICTQLIPAALPHEDVHPLPCTLQGVLGSVGLGGFAPTSKVSAKRAEKQQDCTKCLIRAILEAALNEIKLSGLDPSQCNPWGADTAICTLIYWALELFSVWFMVVNCVLPNVLCAKPSVPSPIKNQGLIHVKASWWVHYSLDQASGIWDWQIIFQLSVQFSCSNLEEAQVFSINVFMFTFGRILTVGQVTVI